MSRNRLLEWASITLVIAIITGVFAFGDLSLTNAHLPRLAFLIFMSLFILLLLLTLLRHDAR